MLCSLSQFTLNLEQTEVKLPKAQGIRVKTTDAIAIPLRGKDVQKSSNTADKLRASFEESINVLRRGPSTDSIRTSIAFTPSLGNIPLAIETFHPILQTLLKLQWETHRRRYQAISLTFKSALEEKLGNTQNIIVQKAALKKSNDQLLQLFQEEATTLAMQNFEQRWANELEAARDKFQASPTTTIEDLLSKALDFCARINVEPAPVDVGDLLTQGDKELKARCDALWKTWELHVSRHQSVFKGNLSKLAEIDVQLSALRQDVSTAAVPPEPEMELDGPTSETEIAYKAWMEFVKLLSTLKIDYDIRINVSKKACLWMSQRIKESMHGELAQACIAVLDAEQVNILKNREKVRSVLEEVKESQTTILAELKRASNNSATHYSSALTQMQLTCDLSLEAARETLYQHALNCLGVGGATV